MTTPMPIFRFPFTAPTHLDTRGITDNTIVIFVSDNGGYIGDDDRDLPVTSNAPLRSGKGALYEGGIRVPMIIRWPGRGARGAVCPTPVTTTDLFPTLLAIAGVSTPAGTIDGLDIRNLIAQPDAKLAERDLFFHYPHYYPTTPPVSAIRSGPWKLIEFLGGGPVELYNLNNDPGETNNLADSHQDRSADLLARLKNWRQQVNAQMPAANPAFAQSENR